MLVAARACSLTCAVIAATPVKTSPTAAIAAPYSSEPSQVIDSTPSEPRLSARTRARTTLAATVTVRAAARLA